MIMGIKILILILILIQFVKSSIILSDEYEYENYLNVVYGDQLSEGTSKKIDDTQEISWGSLTLTDINGNLFDPSQFDYISFYIKSPVEVPNIQIQFYKENLPSAKIDLVSESNPNHAASHLQSLKINEWEKLKIEIPSDTHYDSIHFNTVGDEENQSEDILVRIDRVQFEKKTAKFDLSQILYRLKASYADPLVGGANGGFAFWTADEGQWIFGSYNSWIFAGDTGRLHALPNGDVVVHGGLVPSNDPSSCHSWYVHILFTPTHAPAQPHKELSPNAYVPYGPIDPSTWNYYLPVPGYAYMIGTGCNHVGKITFTGVQEGMPMQLGKGANGKNTVLGASVWMTYMDEYGISHGNSVIDMNVDILNI